MNNILALNFTVGLFLLLISCGVKEADYTDYSDTEVESECTAGLAAFEEHIFPAMATCANSGCHGIQTKIRGENLSDSDAKISRTTLLAFEDISDQTTSLIFNKITSGSHGGGNQGQTLPLENIVNWQKAECL